MEDSFNIYSVVFGLLVALLAAECLILHIQSQAMRKRLDGSLEDIEKDERSKFEIRSLELESEIKERSMRLESEYSALILEAKNNAKKTGEALHDALHSSDEAKRNLRRLKQEADYVAKLRSLADKYSAEYRQKLTDIADLDKEAAEKFLQNEVDENLPQLLDKISKNFIKKSSEELEQEAKYILSNVIQRSAVAKNAEMNSSIVVLPNEAMKGRLIGKEGRNIRSFEACTETTLVVDETPDSVMISAFDPMRRAAAKIALEALVKDGRISPVSIESAVASANSEVEKLAIDAGKNAVEQLGIKRIHPDIIAELGRLRFHLSLNQNTLEHSLECARIASLLAQELGQDSALAKRAALLHDIGKVSPSELPHAQAGAELLRRCGESDAVVEAVLKHHCEGADISIYAAIVKTADAISSTRLGARMAPAEGYFQRVKSLEDIALSFEGVVSAYALAAGKELRIIVEPDTVDDIAAKLIASSVREKIQESLDTSVPIKITLIREKRFTETTS